MREEIVENDLDYILDLISDFDLQRSDTIGDLVEALEEEEAAFEPTDDEDDDETAA